MAERSTISQQVQVGVETTSGTSVAANKLLSALSIMPSPQIDVNKFRAMGFKYPTVQAIGKDWSQSDLNGVVTYTECIYPLSGLLGTAVVSTVGTTGKQWLWTPASAAEDVPKTYTVEVGSAVRAHKFTYGLVTDLSFSISRDDFTIGGTMIGRAITDGITLTASPTAIALRPTLPTQVSVYYDTTSAGLGTTKLLRVLNCDINISNKYGAVWPIDAAQASFATHVETEPTIEVVLTLEADAAGMALLTDLRAGTTKFIRVEAVGAAIPGGTANDTWRFDAAVKGADVGDFSDEDGVYAIQITLNGYHDATWGKAWQMTVINDLATL